MNAAMRVCIVHKGLLCGSEVSKVLKDKKY